MLEGADPYFAEHFRVIAFDPRGKKSDRPEVPEACSLDEVIGDVITVMDATKTEKRHIGRIFFQPLPLQSRLAGRNGLRPWLQRAGGHQSYRPSPSVPPHGRVAPNRGASGSGTTATTGSVTTRIS